MCFVFTKSTKLVFIIRFAIVLILMQLLTACLTTQTTSQDKTYIPYSKVIEQIEFWQYKSQSKFAKLNHVANVKGDQGFSMYLTNQQGDKLEVLETTEQYVTAIDFPMMTLDEAKLWTLIVDRPEWMVRISPLVDIELKLEKVRYQQLFVVLSDMNENMKMASDMPSWLQREYDRLLITFKTPASITYINDSGEEQVLQQEKLKSVILRFNQENYDENGWLLFSELPNGILPLN